MITCCDTSFLYSLYSGDIHSVSAQKYIYSDAILISLTPFNRFEFYNAFRLSEFRKLLSTENVLCRLANFEKDLEIGYFFEAFCNLASVLVKAQHLSASHVSKEGHRAFDILHVAAALHLQADVFLTFDHKQKMLAKSQGLKTPL